MPEESTLTRGKLLKRAGVVGAAAWSVPLLASTASADVGIELNASGCFDGSSMCCNTAYCARICGSKNGQTCGCAVLAKGNNASGACVCVGNVFCSNSPACTTSRDCPRGWKCTFNNCGRTCVPPCGSGDLSCSTAATARATAGG
jgi:hypothetical protein